MKGVYRITITITLLACTACEDTPVESKTDSAQEQQGAMVELETDLPSAWEEAPTPRRNPAEPFLVPQGTRLLSRGVKVTSSDKWPILGELELVTDGNKKKASGYAYSVELGSGLQWVQLDLGKPHALHAILVWHDYWMWNNFPGEYAQYQRVYQDVVVQVSNDPAFKKDVITVFNNDHDNSSGLGTGQDDIYLETSEGRWINPEGVRGRYVRLWSNESTLQASNGYIEVEVYGK